MDSLRLAPLIALAITATLKGDSVFEIPVDITALGSEPPREVRALIREANALWQPTGVRLTWMQSALSRALPQPALRLEVVCDDSEETEAARDGLLRLGSTTFRDGTGVADRRVVLSVKSVQRLVDTAGWSGRRVSDWPPAIREELMGRALGRVVAHEIGHVLFAWRRHTPHGLMRAQFGAVQLLDLDRRPFAVPADLLPRLRAHLEQLTGRVTTLMAVE